MSERITSHSNVNLVSEHTVRETFLSIWRELKVSIYLNILMLSVKTQVEESKEKALKEYIDAKDKKYLIFAVNNHNSDVDAMALYRAIQKKFPQLKGKLAILADKKRWEKPENRAELEATLGSYILFDRDITTRGLASSLKDIQTAMDQGFALIFFTEGTRNQDAPEGNFALLVAAHLEKSTDDTDLGVLIADVSLHGLEEVHQKVPEGEEKKQRMEAIKRRWRAIVPHRPEDWKQVSVVIHDLISTREEDGQKKSRLKVKNEYESAREKRHQSLNTSGATGSEQS